MVKSIKELRVGYLFIVGLLLLQAPTVLALEFIDCPTEVSAADLRTTTYNVPDGWSHGSYHDYLHQTFQLMFSYIDSQRKEFICGYGFIMKRPNSPIVGSYVMATIHKPAPPATIYWTTATGFGCESRAKRP